MIVVLLAWYHACNVCFEAAKRSFCPSHRWDRMHVFCMQSSTFWLGFKRFVSWAASFAAQRLSIQTRFWSKKGSNLSKSRLLLLMQAMPDYCFVGSSRADTRRRMMCFRSEVTMTSWRHGLAECTSPDPTQSGIVSSKMYSNIGWLRCCHKKSLGFASQAN